MNLKEKLAIREKPINDALEKYPPIPKEVDTRLHLDGSVVDQ